MNEANTPMSAEPWRKTLLAADATLQQAIVSLDASGLQIAMVVNADGSLVGTLTDGDIRRGLLRGLDMQSPVASIVNREPLVVPPHMERELVLQLMQANKVRQLPVVDGQRSVVGLHVWDELLVPEQRPNTMVIMAGGKGMRLRPYTEQCPKPMLPVNGKPMLEHIIERARGEGFQRFVLAVHYLGHMVEDYFGDGGRWQVHIDYLREEFPLGTAGALALLAEKPAMPLIVTNGDVLTDIHYGELLDFHNHHGAAATMAVRMHEWQHPFGVVRTSGVDIVGFEEKPVIKSHINAGVYALAPGVLDHMQRGEHCDMPTLFGRLQERGQRTVVYPMHEPWLDVGRVDDYNAANQNAES
ncbi:MAG: nucleotidyltransferase family protein [Methylophilaceae bacterium]|jgi:dTDP-glucose pyrophosphorylase